MIDKEHRDFIRQCAEAFMALGPHYAPAMTEEDAGVPIDMMLDEPDAEGMVAWKVVWSDIDDEELVTVEARLPGHFPPLFRAYLTTMYILGLQFGKVWLPHIPSHAPFQMVKDTVQRWSLLMESNYVAFSENDDGPLCFDLGRRAPNGDCPVVCFDYEELLALGRDQWDQRDLLEKSARRLFPSFETLMTTLFLQRKFTDGP
ncbi:MAG: hypothetical protein HN348_07435 [Proteobacteria bacterium]|nr:hypothetical protein [Pseudomonadota bacterium]